MTTAAEGRAVLDLDAPAATAASLCRADEQPSWLVAADAFLARAALVARGATDRSLTDPVLQAVGALVGTGTDDEGAPAGVEDSTTELANVLVATADVALEDALQPGRPLAVLAETAGLTGAEATVLALCVAVELDPQRQAIASYLGGDNAGPWLTPWSLRRVVEDDEIALAVGPGGGLRRACLLVAADDRPWALTPLRPHPSVTWWLQGDQSPDPALPPETEMLDAVGGGVARLVVAASPDRIRRLQAVTEALDATGFLVCAATADEFALDAVVRRASLSGEAVVLDVKDRLPAPARARIERAFHLRWAITSAHELPLDDLPRRPWQQLTAAPPLADSEEVAALFDADQSADVGLNASQLTASQLDAAATAMAATGGDVPAALRRIAAGEIEQLATRIRPGRTWDDLVLAPHKLELVHYLVDRARHRHVVYGDWGFSPLPSRGVVGMFAGPSGTGKTLTAEIIAGELGLDLYRIDLSQLVSKYIGETEQNLAKVFAAAEASPVVLFFDEADALLGKRSEVRDSHDRYANIEVAYLLQRLERYDGVVLLATNLAGNMDTAFARRIHVTVEFTLPDRAERRRIWERSLPSTAPLASDVDLDRLADFVDIPGGAITNAATAAAFLAATANEPIGMATLVLAVKRELQKLGRLIPGETPG
ncbi:MAG: ATP-binding protein [Frankiaceae bacterium]|nr:ATP-binding protein [Frankiaceae bacterium]